MMNNIDEVPELLQEQLEQEIIAASLEDYALKAGVALLRENERLSQLPEYQQPQKLRQKHSELISGRTKMRRRFPRKLIMLVAALLAFFLLSCATVGQDIFQFLKQEFSEFISVSNRSEATKNVNSYVDWQNQYIPAYEASGYKFSSHSVSGDLFIVEYVNSDEELIVFTILSGSSQTLLDDSDADESRDIKINGADGVLTSKDGFINLLWGTSPQFRLSGSCDPDELIKMAQSVPPDIG